MYFNQIYKLLYFYIFDRMWNLFNQKPFNILYNIDYDNKHNNNLKISNIYTLNMYLSKKAISFCNVGNDRARLTNCLKTGSESTSLALK